MQNVHLKPISVFVESVSCSGSGHVRFAFDVKCIKTLYDQCSRSRESERGGLREGESEGTCVCYTYYSPLSPQPNVIFNTQEMPTV